MPVPHHRRRPPRIVASASPHGYGHAAVITAILATIRARCPDAEVVILSAAPRDWLAARVPGPFACDPQPAEADFGMVMRSATGVLVDESLAAYQRAHAGWPAPVDRQAARLAVWRPDVVLSCASYTVLAAARRLGVPALGVGPFSWLEIAAAYLGDRAAAAPELARMAEAYAAATAFLFTEPAVGSRLRGAGKRNAVAAVGPVGLPAVRRRAALAAALDAAPDERLVLVAMGGIAEPSPVAGWPPLPGWRLVEPAALPGLGFTPSMAIASCDVVLTKPGYGTYVEVACAGTAVLSRRRPDWPESAGLAAWFRRHGALEHVDDETFLRGAVAGHLQKLVTSGPPRLAIPSGNQQVAEIVLECAGW